MDMIKRILFLFALVMSAQAQTSPTVRVNSLADLQALPIPIVNSHFSAIVGGTLTNGDQLGGVFTWVPSATDATNSLNFNKVIAHPYGSVSGRWILNGYFNHSGLIRTNLTLTIKSAGGDFTSVNSALIAISDMTINPGVTVTLEIDDGVFTDTTPIYLVGVFNKSIIITGKHIYNRTVSSVQSSAGAAGNWDIVLNVNSVANMSTSDYVNIYDSAGGVNPTYLAGTFQVSNVDVVNSRITIHSTHHAAVAPSGAITANVTVFKSILKFTGSDGIQIFGGGTAINLDHVAFVGDGTHYGISLQDNGRVFVIDTIGVAHWSYGVFANYSSELNSSGLVSSSDASSFNYIINTGAVCDVSKLISSGGLYGFYADTGGEISSPASISTGNTLSGYFADNNSTIDAPGSSSTGNLTYGYESRNLAWVNHNGDFTANNSIGSYNLEIQSDGAGHLAIQSTPDNSRLTIENIPSGAIRSIYLKHLTRNPADSIFESTGSSAGNEAVLTAESRLSLGGTSPVSRLDISPTTPAAGVFDMVTGFNLRAGNIILAGPNPTVYNSLYAAKIAQQSLSGVLAGQDVTTAGALYLEPVGIASTNATINTSYGLRIGSANVGAQTTVSYGLGVSAPAGATNNYAGFFTGGNVGFGLMQAKTPISVTSDNDAESMTPGTASGAASFLDLGGIYGLFIGVSQSTGNTWMQVARNDGNTTVYRCNLQPNGGGVSINTTNSGAILNIQGGINGSGNVLRVINSTRSLTDEIVHFEGFDTNSVVSINAGGNVALGTITHNAAAAFQVDSTAQGILLPRMTKAQRDAIGAPPDGLMIYQTDGTVGLHARQAGAWVVVNTTADP